MREGNVVSRVCLFTRDSSCDHYQWWHWSVTGHMDTPDLFKPVHLGPPPRPWCPLVVPTQGSPAAWICLNFFTLAHTSISKRRLAFNWKALWLLVIMPRTYFKTFTWNAWNNESFVICLTLWSLNTLVWQTVIGQKCHYLLLANLLCTSFAHLMGMAIMLNCDLLSFIIT